MHKLKIISLTLATIILIFSVIWLLQPSESLLEQIPEIEYAEQPVPDFTQYTQVSEKKQAFFNYLAPAVKLQNEYILMLRQVVQGFRAKQVAGEVLSDNQQEELAWLVKEYRVAKYADIEQTYSELLEKIDIIPLALVLVQSANESAWGTSRFAVQGYNFFGLWCFSKGCGFVPSRRNEGANHEVAKFDDLSDAMYVYMRNLNRHPAYAQLRQIRAQHRKDQKPITAYSLIEGLSKYSERGHEYVDELRHMIRINQELIPL